MNDQPSPLSPQTLRPTMIATMLVAGIVAMNTVMAAVGDLDALLGVIGITAVVMFSAGRSFVRTRTALHSLHSYALETRVRA